MVKKYHKFKDYLVEKLHDPEEAKAFLDAAIEAYGEDGNSAALALALRCITEAQGGVSKLARKSKQDRKNLYKIFEGKTTPRLDTFNAIISGLGYRLRVEDNYV